MSEDLTHIDRLCAEKMMMSTSISKEDAWHAMFLVDSSLHVNVFTRHIAWSECRARRVVNSVTIPDLSNYIYSLSYRRSLSTQKSKLCYLLSKVLNEKCQARKFSSVFLDCYEPKHNIAKYIKNIVLCGLLGAYPTSNPSSRPRPEVRARLYELISNCSFVPPLSTDHVHPIIKSEDAQTKQRKKVEVVCATCSMNHPHGGAQAENWFLYLLTLGGIVVLYCIREYIHYMLQLNPCLLSQIKDEIKYKETLNVTQKAMNAIRKYFDRNLTNPFSDMYKFTEDVMIGNRSFDMKQTEELDPTSWFYQLSCIMYPYQKSMLLISHNRSNKTMQESLLTACKKLNMVPIPSNKIQKEQLDSECKNPATSSSSSSTLFNQDQSNETLNDIVMNQIYEGTKLGLNGIPKKDVSSSPSNHLEDAVVTEHRKMIGMCITKQHMDIIYDILKRSTQDETSDAIETISIFLTLFGVDRRTKNFVQQVIKRRKTNKVSDEKLRSFLVVLHKKKPHAYNILQATAYISHNLTAFSITSVLPNYITRNQITAIQSRFGTFMMNTSYIPETACNIFYCSVCHTIYSIIRDFMYGSKQSYEYGILEAFVDHKTNLMYCKNKVVGTGESCATTPLTGVNILGLLMRIKDQPIMLCPQLYCGVPMILSNQCAWTERGPCCSKCTVKRNSDHYIKMDTASSLLEEPFDKNDTMTHPTCAVCGCVLGSLGKMFWYPHSIVVCCFHTSNSISKKFRELYAGSEMDKEQALNLLNYLLHERKEMAVQRKRSRDKRLRDVEERKRRNGTGISVEPGEVPLSNIWTK